MPRDGGAAAGVRERRPAAGTEATRNGGERVKPSVPDPCLLISGTLY